MADRKRYTVLIPYPLGGGHWSRKGQILELLDVQAQQLETAGRIAPLQATSRAPHARHPLPGR